MQKSVADSTTSTHPLPLDYQKADLIDLEHNSFAAHRGSCLLIDPDSADRTREALLLRGNGWTVHEACEPGEALRVAATQTFNIIVTEILFDAISSTEFLGALRRIAADAVIVIYTAQEERRTGPDRRLGNVFEFLTKPTPSHKLLGCLRRSLEFYNEKLRVMSLATQSDQRMRNKLEWLIWKEKRFFRNRISTERAFVENIRHSIMQGTGFGLLSTQIELLSLTGVRDEKMVHIPVDLFDELLSTSADARCWLNSLDSIAQTFQATYQPEILSSNLINEILGECVSAIEPLRKVKDQPIHIDRANFSYDVVCSRASLCLVIRELLTNALKYSPDGSSVDVTCYPIGNSLCIAVLNDPIKSKGGITGVPAEMEQQVFEPFFRINNSYDERYRAEELSMGIGLAVVQSALSQTGATVHMHEITDYASEPEPRKRVVVEVVLPTHTS